MSWVKIDDGFEDNGKVALISDAAHRLWMRAICWSAKNENLHLGGFIPVALLEKVSGGLSKRKRERLAKELVEADAAGTKDCGLWEEVSNGFQIHDWHKYRPEKEPMPRAQAASIAGKKSAEARRRKNGTAQPQRRNEHRTSGERSGVRSANDVRPNDEGNDNRTSRTPDPVPDPVDPKDADVDPRLPSKSDEPPTQQQHQRPPGNLEAALKIPVTLRAQLLLDNDHTLTFVQPHKWRELQRLGERIAEKAGWHPPRWSSATGKAVMPLVRLLAEFSLEELGRFIEAIPDDEWFSSEKGFTWLSDEVVRRTLGKAGGSRVSDEEDKRRDEEREEREQRAQQAAWAKLGVGEVAS